MPNPEWRPWLYAVAWLGGGVAYAIIDAGGVALLTWGPWATETAPQRLDIIGRSHLINSTIPALVMLGLGLRNAIRTIKGTAGADGASLEVSGHETGKGQEP